MIKVAIHQPEHFPYMGFFQKMKAADIFVILDDVQFTKNNWQNRNKFTAQDGSEQYFTIPVPKNSNRLLINEVIPLPDLKWRRKIVTQLEQRYGLDLTNIYDRKFLLDMNLASIIHARKALDIDTKMILSSGIDTGDAVKNERILAICQHLKADTYLSGEGAIEYLKPELFEEAGIELEVFHPDVSNYDTVLSHI